jgi:hypothetical protein
MPQTHGEFPRSRQPHRISYEQSSMVNIRQATVDDLIQMQTTNLWCLPENYQVRLANACLSTNGRTAPCVAD